MPAAYRIYPSGNIQPIQIDRINIRPIRGKKVKNPAIQCMYVPPRVFYTEVYSVVVALTAVWDLEAQLRQVKNRALRGPHFPKLRLYTVIYELDTLAVNKYI
jgi:hypothetical protein